LRILFEQALTDEEVVLKKPNFRWNIDRSFDEYLAFLDGKKKAKESAKTDS
jgi:hypothetical protein